MAIPVAQFVTLFPVPCPDCESADAGYTVTFVGERGDEGVIVSCSDCGRTSERFGNHLAEPWVDRQGQAELAAAARKNGKKGGRPPKKRETR